MQTIALQSSKFSIEHGALRGIIIEKSLRLAVAVLVSRGATGKWGELV
jgi:hypothetical protein